MADLSGFDANQVEPNSTFDPIPEDEYQAVITDSEMKRTKRGTGHFLQLTFQISEGEHKNRLLWSRLNLDNPNPQAVSIAQGDLSAICRAVGVLAPTDSVDLHNLPLVIHVRCVKRKDTGGITNEIKGFSKKKAVVPAGDAHTTDETSPWKRS